MNRRDVGTDLLIGIGAAILVCLATCLGGCAHPEIAAKKTISGVAEAVHAAEASWKVADQAKMLQIVINSTDVTEARARIGMWQSSVQPKVNQAFATIGTAVMTAERTMRLVAAGLAKNVELIPLARDLYAQFQELRALLTMYDVTFALPGGL